MASLYRSSTREHRFLLDKETIYYTGHVAIGPCVDLQLKKCLIIKKQQHDLAFSNATHCVVFHSRERGNRWVLM